VGENIGDEGNQFLNLDGHHDEAFSPDMSFIAAV
jgi:hypothetical protein